MESEPGNPAHLFHMASDDFGEEHIALRIAKKDCRIQESPAVDQDPAGFVEKGRRKGASSDQAA
jgi:hypothetical protein